MLCHRVVISCCGVWSMLRLKRNSFWVSLLVVTSGLIASGLRAEEVPPFDESTYKDVNREEPSRSPLPPMLQRAENQEIDLPNVPKPVALPDLPKDVFHRTVGDRIKAVGQALMPIRPV